MISLAEARAHVLDRCPGPVASEVPLADARGLVTAAPVVASGAVPPFANSAMDGFALLAADTVGPPAELRIVGTLAAGAVPDVEVRRGEAVRIMTGAPMPLGADAVAIGTAALVALGDNDPKWEAEYQKMGTTTGAYDDWHEGQDPAGITTQDPELAQRLDPEAAGRRLRNYLNVMTLECQTIARACGKSHVHNLEPEDLVALTMEAAAMARVPLSGTDWWPGKPGTGF